MILRYFYEVINVKDKVYVPPIKSQGIKTKLVPWIKNLVPSDFNGIWIEPFMGTGVVAFNVRPKKAIMCDTNPHIIDVYNDIKSKKITKEKITSYLIKEGDKLNDSDGEYYYEVRERFNEFGDSFDFIFLNRSCFNGMIRFNKKGGFNVPFCKKPNRFAQSYITKISNQVNRISEIISSGEYNFICQPFDKTISMAESSDIIYCDPPYIGRHADYFNSWGDKEERLLHEKLSSLKSYFIMSTWHHNDYRENEYIKELWCEFNILKKEHFYHVGASEKNRSPMIEALITNMNKDIIAKIEKIESKILILEE
ncbi:DNA adenine methylase [Erwinia piriflorinigrans CFBP 5888]|uniref:Site-specific DNA-methyltransferase (adenine-specific) n=1 Tax=Erwinia piriflorinigrans CFBP 5888 TaxID=1161919 RepID=V5ZDD3_9GAMM|nr:DNA adenine methylase [Erwinia piriflorinigrans CFBP 5888]